MVRSALRRATVTFPGPGSGRAFDIYDLTMVAALGALVVWMDSAGWGGAALALIGVLVLVWRFAPETSSERRRTRLIVLLALASLIMAAGSQTARFATSWDVRVWNVYHYYLGAKYFEELGYTGLYDATLQADREGEDYWHDIGRVRSLVTYEVNRRSDREGLFEPRESFSPERWQAFRQDVEALSGQRSARAWRGIFVDRGYNATPVWTVLGSALARLAPADHPLALKLLCSLDLVLLAATVGLIASVFGVRQASLVVLLLTMSPVNANRFVGGFLQYDWFCAVGASLCFYRIRRPVPAAGFMAYAVLTRIFPLFFVIAGLIPALWTWWTSNRRPSESLRFLAALVAWCALGMGLSLFNGRGVDGWREFGSNISTHKAHHLYGERRVGLGFLLTHRLGSFDFDESAVDRKETYESQKTVFRAGAAALIVGFLLVVRRQRPEAAQLLGLLPVFALLVTSRYYWSYLALLPLIGEPRGSPADTPRWLAAGQLVVFGAYFLFDSFHGDHYSAYIVLNLLLLAYLVSSLAFSAWCRGVAQANSTG